jgi:alkanesulfonate monooxygenase SsuD/methylene tetrahydromethanopterin reductase-like flavin-dependent oxidoreductase (luciferase family)
VVSDPEQVSDPDPDAITGTVAEVAEALAAYRELGVDHLIVRTEPMSPRSVERLAEARKLMSECPRTPPGT